MQNELIRKAINYFCFKYKGNWEKVYEAIKSKEPIANNEIKEKYKNVDFISIIDNNYPNNFKEIYMPPLLLYYKGNHNLLNQDNKIISIWNNDISIIQKQRQPKNLIYSFIYNKTQNQQINYLLKEGYKLILIANEYQIDDINNIEFNEQIVFISEVPFDIKKPSLDEEQNIERILLGCSRHSLFLERSIKQFDYLLPLFKFENRKFEVKNISEYSKVEIEKYNIISYLNELN